MGNFGKKVLGVGAIGAACGAAVYYFKKKKDENPGLQEEFADFQDNLKETAASAVSVASKFKEVVEQSVDEAVSKVKEHTDDFVDDDIFEDEDSPAKDLFEGEDVAEEITNEESAVEDAENEEEIKEEEHKEA